MVRQYIQRPIEIVTTIDPGSPDDLFLTCASFEKRCTNSISKLGKSYKTRTALIVRFHGRDRKSRESVQDNTNYLKGLLTERVSSSSRQACVVDCDKEDPLDGFIKVEEILQSEKLILSNKNITVDISTFTKEYLLVLFKLLDISKNRVRVLYTRGKQYDKSLSWGVKSIGSVPFYNGYHTSGRKDLLVIFCGYEGHRSYALWESCEPSKTFAIVGTPDEYRSGDPLEAEKQNRRLLNVGKPLVEEQRAKVYDLNETIKLIREIYNEYVEKKGYNVCISPLGTKVQALGIHAFYKEREREGKDCNLHVLYARPFDYALEYVRESGALWEYLLYEPNAIQASIGILKGRGPSTEDLLAERRLEKTREK